MKREIQSFRFTKHLPSNVIDVNEINMRPMAYMDAIGVIADLLEKKLAELPCDCPDCKTARHLLTMLPRRTPLQVGHA